MKLNGGAVIDAKSVEPSEYLPNKGVFHAGLLGAWRGDGLGLYFGRIEPGAAIAREIHPETSETLVILAGNAICLCGDVEMALSAGQVLHIERNVTHGLRNVGASDVEFLVIGVPDFA